MVYLNTTIRPVYIYVNIYIYVCVCVCVCMWVYVYKLLVTKTLQDETSKS
jgi:hypothetical protein